MKPSPVLIACAIIVLGLTSILLIMVVTDWQPAVHSANTRSHDALAAELQASLIRTGFFDGVSCGYADSIVMVMERTPGEDPSAIAKVRAQAAFLRAKYPAP